MSAGKKEYQKIAANLLGFLSEQCDGIEVVVDDSARWKRMCLTFRWSGFEGMLPEERFRILARLIPQEFVSKHCLGAVWLELAPGESIESYLSLPRSEDVADKAPEILEQLKDTGFFAVLEDEMVRIPPHQCEDSLVVTRKILSARGLADEQVQEVCLVLIGCGAYNDWSVLRDVRKQVEDAPKTKGKKK